jgi:hypothetical protein
MPHALSDVVGSSAGADFVRVAADDFVPGVGLEGPDRFGEEACCDEVEEAGGDYQEDLEFGAAAESGGWSFLVGWKVVGDVDVRELTCR